ncbi:MAG: YkgJ family cysteine cluster protein [Gemmatimonadota bacterium]
MTGSMDEFRRQAARAGAGCGPNCPGYRIPLTPYEAARLADGLGITTGELLRRYLAAGSAILAVKEDGSCVFHRGEEGCEVHRDRPLACRSFLEPTDTPGRFVERARQYREIFRAWRSAGLAGSVDSEAFAGGRERESAHVAPELGTWILDVDSLVAERCAERGTPVPEDLEARIDIHLSALRAALE